VWLQQLPGSPPPFAAPAPRQLDLADLRLHQFLRAVERTQRRASGVWVTRVLQDASFRAAVAERIVDRDETALEAVLHVLRGRVRPSTSAAAARLNEAFRFVLAELPNELRREMDEVTGRRGVGLVLIADRVDWSQVRRIDVARLTALVTEERGAMSGAEDVAWELGIPAVGGVHAFCQTVRTGASILVDGSMGRVFVEPDADILERYRL
jgi:phosphotransferase system enzyme I (PtsI)